MSAALSQSTYAISQPLASAALSMTTNLTALRRTYSSHMVGTVANNRRVLCATLRADGAITETVTVTLDSVRGTAYDTVLNSTSLTAGTSYVYFPSDELILGPGDNLVLECTNNGGAQTVAGQIITSES